MLKFLADENVAHQVVEALRKEKKVNQNKIKNRLIIFQESKIRII